MTFVQTEIEGVPLGGAPVGVPDAGWPGGLPEGGGPGGFPEGGCPGGLPEGRMPVGFGPNGDDGGADSPGVAMAAEASRQRLIPKIERRTIVTIPGFR